MDIKDLDDHTLVKLITDQVERVTCIQCLKHYLVPTTAPCGHTLCQSCWRLLKVCPSCRLHIEKKDLKLNLTMQLHTEHVITLKEKFESLFKIKLDEFNMYPEEGQQRIKEWLANSQNIFSAPVTNSEQFIPETVMPNHVTSEVHIHTANKQRKEQEVELLHMNSKQEDWDKIEVISETEINTNFVNPVGPTDIEPFEYIKANEYTINNCRRSKRNKEKNNSENIVPDNKKLNKLAQNWNNVKRMKKEFSKLNKKNRSKLNISIEMCKKSNVSTNNGPQPKSQAYNIEENTLELAANELTSSNNTNFKNNNKVNNEITVAINEDMSADTENATCFSNKLSNNNNVFANIQDNNKNDNSINTKINENVDNIEKDRFNKVSFFKKSALHTKSTTNEHVDSDTNKQNNSHTVDTDDIEIIIKIGKMVTNICIKKKENDVQVKTNTDREIQTSLCTPSRTRSNAQNNTDINHIIRPTDLPMCTQSNVPKLSQQKSISIQKNTTSADTSTVNYEITESVEKELVNHMEHVQFVNEQQEKASQIVLTAKQPFMPLSKSINHISEDVELLNDLDIFDGESLKEGNIHILKSVAKTPSEIIMPTSKSNSRSQKAAKKRYRDIEDGKELPNIKMMKITQENTKNINADSVLLKGNVIDEDSENINYDSVISQVFANINADMENMHRSGYSIHERVETMKTSNNKNKLQPINHNIASKGDVNKTKTKKCLEEIDQKCSENVFSLLGKDDINSAVSKTTSDKPLEYTQHLVTNSKEFCSPIEEISNHDKLKNLNNDKMSSQSNDVDMAELSTPIQEDDDKSIVEETPQKSTSFLKNRNIDRGSISTDNVEKEKESINNSDKKYEDVDADDLINVINISDSLDELIKGPKNRTTVEIARLKSTSETPLTTINNFFNEITHKSTPVARKSLNFNCQNVVVDPEETISSNILVPQETTQEKEFISKAFERSLTSPSQTLCMGKNRKRLAKLCIAGSCLTTSEQANLKLLCLQRSWSFVEKYSKDLTHLVVGVDEENKSQRSVKYICALASSKWIVTYQWVEKCVQVNCVVDEEPFEALDWTGEPGPRRSRLAKQKLFKGITFYCMPPFSILDIETLKDILEVSGGRVVNEAKSVQVTDEPALLLAEPEHTQEDRFVYLAMELKIVPVNYEWMLNCLGSYTLSPIYELLLCPDSLLPPATSKWPPELISRSYE